MRPPEKIGAQTVDGQPSISFMFLTSLLLVRRGWFANKGAEATRRSVVTGGWLFGLGSFLTGYQLLTAAVSER
jgi:hypothetical protein